MKSMKTSFEGGLPESGKLFRQELKAGGRARRTKRAIAAIAALLLTLSISATALADNGKGAGVPGGQSQQGGQSRQPQSSPDPAQDGQGQKNGQENGARNMEMSSGSLEKIEEAIAALTDETAKAELTALLETYEAAVDARQTAVESKDTSDLSTLSSAVSAAKTALDAALEEAGVDTDELYGVPELAQDGTGRMANRPSMDTTEIAAAIAALDDSDGNKATLTTLLDAYEAALEAQSSASSSSLTNDEIKALADAVQTAEQALLEATKAAGITGGVGRGQFVNGNGNAPLDTESVAARIAALGDTDANKATLNTLLAAYETALAAQNGADASALTQDEIDALADATNKAEQALEEALKNAGLSDEPIREQNQQQISQNQPQTADENQYQVNVVSEGTQDGSTDTSGILSTFFQWLGSLFK